MLTFMKKKLIVFVDTRKLIFFTQLHTSVGYSYELVQKIVLKNTRIVDK